MYVKCEVCGREKEEDRYPINDAPIYMGTDYPKDWSWERRKVCWVCMYSLEVMDTSNAPSGGGFTLYKDWKKMDFIFCPSCISKHAVDEHSYPKLCRCGYMIERPNAKINKTVERSKASKKGWETRRRNDIEKKGMRVHLMLRKLSKSNGG